MILLLLKLSVISNQLSVISYQLTADVCHLTAQYKTGRMREYANGRSAHSIQLSPVLIGVS
jgi:hypothetical protein